MPQHVYAPRNDPPSMWDRVKMHSADLGLAVLAVSASLQVLLTPLLRAYAPSQSLRAIDPELGLILAVFLGVGGGLAIIGLLWSGSKISTGWVLEQIGWILAGSAWLGYGALVAYAFPYSTLAYTIAGAIGIICLFRAYVVLCIDRSIRSKAQAVRLLREGRGPA
jgi:hypothetical protein